MVVTQSMRRTFAVLPKPIKLAVKFVLPKRNRAPKVSLIEQVESMGAVLIAPLTQDR